MGRWRTRIILILFAAAGAPPWAHGQSDQKSDQKPLAFEVASVKLNTSGNAQSASFVMPGARYTATNMTLRELLRTAFFVHETQIVGGPSWLDSDKFDIVASANQNIPTSVFRDQFRVALRGLLGERFKLTTHSEKKELPVYALVVVRRDGKLGPQLHRSDAECVSAASQLRTGQPIDPKAPMPCGAGFSQPGHLAARALDFGRFVASLIPLTDRVVVNRTNLSGPFDWDVQWTPALLTAPDVSGLTSLPHSGAAAAAPDSSVSLFTALNEQLGLKLDPQSEPVDAIVIDHAERPTPD